MAKRNKTPPARPTGRRVKLINHVRSAAARGAAAEAKKLASGVKMAKVPLFKSDSSKMWKVVLTRMLGEFETETEARVFFNTQSGSLSIGDRLIVLRDP